MAKVESKVQKVARKNAGPKDNSVGTCQCGGKIIWAKVFAPSGRMVKVCEQCGYGA